MSENDNQHNAVVVSWSLEQIFTLFMFVMGAEDFVPEADGY